MAAEACVQMRHDAHATMKVISPRDDIRFGSIMGLKMRGLGVPEQAGAR